MIDHISVSVLEAVAAPLNVASLGNGIDRVDVIDAVRRSEQRAPRTGGCSTVNGVDHGHAVVPVPERGHAHEGDHVQGVDHVFFGAARALAHEILNCSQVRARAGAVLATYREPLGRDGVVADRGDRGDAEVIR